MIGKVTTSKRRKGHTKLQMECLALRPKLDKYWRSKIRACRNLFTVHGWYHRKRSLVWCEACGQVHHQEFPEMGTNICLNENEYLCPHCGAPMIVNETPSWSKLPLWSAMQYAYVTNINNWTVVRVFYIERFSQMNHRQRFYVHEVWQRWINEKGKEVILTREYHRSPFYFRWDFKSDWKCGRHNEHCSGYYISSDVFDLYGTDIGEIDVAPILKRNGWRDELRNLRIDMVKLWQLILTNPMVEELVKHGQEQVVAYLMRCRNDDEMLRKWIHAIRICIRNDYKIKDVGMWFDHLDLLEHFGKDTHNPKYVCPANLSADHHRLIMKRQEQEVAEEVKKEASNIGKYEPQYKKHRGMYFGICFGNEDITISVLSSVWDFFVEGVTMRHCVFTNKYYDSKSHPDSLILSARDRDGNRLETVEVSTKTWDIIQSRGFMNGTTDEHDNIVKLVKENMNILKNVA